jgi:hypothetical protein
LPEDTELTLAQQSLFGDLEDDEVVHANAPRESRWRKIVGKTAEGKDYFRDEKTDQHGGAGFSQATQMRTLALLILLSACGGSEETAEPRSGNGGSAGSSGSSSGGGSSDASDTCGDGIQNGGETGVDCGGPCWPCVPASCSDGVENGDETGLDCGGSCPACDAGSACGAADAVCCSEDPPCRDGLTCKAGVCVACGELDQACCADSTCNGSLVCTASERCAAACGGPKQPCCAGSTCSGKIVCNLTVCDYLALPSGVSCGNDCKTPNELCQAHGFSGAVETFTYFIGQCGGPGECPSGWVGLTCPDWCGGSNCVNNPYCGGAYPVVTGTPSPTTVLCASAVGDCIGDNPGFYVRAHCS